MIAYIRLHVFSGRPDPEWTLRDPEARKLVATAELLPLSTSDPVKIKPRLGYNGFSVTIINGGETSGMNVYKGWLRDSRGALRVDDGRRFERYVYELAPPRVLLAIGGMSFVQLLTTGNEVPIKGLNPPGKTSTATCATGPSAPTSKAWATHTNYNNCYNYANDVLNTDQWSPSALPGSLTDMPASTVTSTVRKIFRTQIKKDGLTRVAGDKVPAACPATNKHYIAIVLRHHPGSTAVQDFHCFRLDTDGTWSHKDGSKLPRNRDDAGTNPSQGDIINDLSTAKFDGDPVLVGIYRAKKGNSKIK